MTSTSRAIGALVLAVTVGCAGTPAASPSPTGAPTAPPTSTPTAAPTPAPTAAPSPSPTPAPTPSPEPSPTPAAQTLTFDDGALTIEVPAGALPDGVELNAIPRGPDDLPPELADLEVRNAFYSLEPDGLTFAQPVRVTRRVAIPDIGIDVSKLGMPVVNLALRTSDGVWEWLANQSVLMDEEFLYVSGDATHTSMVMGLGGDHFARSTYTPPELNVHVGGTFMLDVTLLVPITAPKPPEFHSGEPFTHTGIFSAALPQIYNSPNWADTPVIDRHMQFPRLSQEFECAQPGTFYTIVGYEVQNIGAGNFFFSHLNLDPPSTTLQFELEGECLANGIATPDLGAVPTEGCLVVVHTPIGTFISHLRLELGFEQEIQRVEVTFAGANDNGPVLGEPTREDLFIILLGLRAAGPKTLEEVLVTTADGTVHDVTAQVAELLGGQEFVVPFPGEPTFGSCPR